MRTTRTLCLLALIAVAVPAGLVAAEERIAAGEPCCFTNPRYAGVCQVVPGEDETCASILAYLNNQGSVGKTYCGSTTVRGGWSQVSCDSGASATACEPPAEPHDAQLAPVPRR